MVDDPNVERSGLHALRTRIFAGYNQIEVFLLTLETTRPPWRSMSAERLLTTRCPEVVRGEHRFAGYRSSVDDPVSSHRGATPRVLEFAEKFSVCIVFEKRLHRVRDFLSNLMHCEQHLSGRILDGADRTEPSGEHSGNVRPDVWNTQSKQKTI